MAISKDATSHVAAYKTKVYRVFFPHHTLHNTVSATATENTMPLRSVYNDDYQNYKANAKTIFNWRMRAIKTAADKDRFTPVLSRDQSHSSLLARNQSHLSLPLKDQIVGIAEQLVKHNVQTTRNLQSAFDNALRNRHKVIRYYIDVEIARCNHLSINTEQHVHFIDLLAQAYKVLFPDTVG
jgi:hypothetical protein